MFSVTLPNGNTISRVDDFVEYLFDNGCEISAHIRVASAVMGFAYCINKKEIGLTPKPDEPEYFDIPFAVFNRTGIYSYKTETEAVMPMLHSGINFVCKGNIDGIGEIDFTIQYYLSMGDKTQWNVRNSAQDDVPWNKGKIVDEWNSKEDILRLVRTAAWVAVVFNGLALKEHLYSFGYGLIGVCADSAAIVQYTMRGETTLFPLCARGEYRIRLSKEFKFLKSILHQKKLYEQKDEDDLEILSKTSIELPNDNAIDSSRYKDSILRMSASIPWEDGEEPFLVITQTRRILKYELEEHQF